MGTAYGQEIQFTTSGTLPTLTTNVATSITSTSAVSGGSISSDGGAAVIQRGVCWSGTVSNPTTSNSTLISGSGTGNFSSFISGLSSTTVYYLRAFATNSAGSWWNGCSFPVPPPPKRPLALLKKGRHNWHPFFVLSVESIQSISAKSDVLLNFTGFPYKIR